MDDVVAACNRKHNDLFAKVQPMEEAVEAVKHLVSSRLYARRVEVDNVCVDMAMEFLVRWRRARMRIAGPVNEPGTI